MIPKGCAYIVLCSLLLVSDTAEKPNDFVEETDSNGCTLPPHPEHGHWELLNGKGNPGDTVLTASVLTFECEPRYKLSSKIPLVCLGEWSLQAPQCEELCPPLYPSNAYDLRCIDKLGKEINCAEATHGTNLEYTCKTFYETPFGYKKTLYCENGKWDNPKPVCQPVCGKKNSNDAKTLIYGSKPNEMIEHPWVVAIYKKTNDSYENICGGSILSQTVVLTAAHCVTDNYGNALSEELYIVGVGKLYIRYLAPEDTRAQYLELFKIIVPAEYKADSRRFSADIAVLVVKEEITINEVVQPVCFTNMKNIHLHAGNKGEVSGWGLAEGGIPSEVLRSLVIPYKYETVCADELPSDWADKYNLRDKICAGFVNKSTAVCSGDSGGGLVFKYREDNRYYIHGIVSLSPQAGGMCNNQQNAIYTSVASYYDFVDRLLIKYAPRIKDCILPPHPKNGKWITEQQYSKPGDLVPSNTTLDFECNQGFLLSSTEIVDCSSAHKIPKCEKLCNPLQFPTETQYNCFNRYLRMSDCNTAIDGWTLVYSCPSGYKKVNDFPIRNCVKGSWGTPKPECIPECGKTAADFSGIGSQYPWNVGVYKLNDKMGEKYKYVCGGSLISENVVVTAAQCVTDKSSYSLTKDDYAITAGKLYRKYDDPREKHAQFSNVTYIIVHPNYKLSKSSIRNIAFLIASSPFSLNSFVHPVCINEVTLAWWNEGDTGLMVGWRFVEGVSPETVEPIEVVRLLKDNCTKLDTSDAVKLGILFTGEKMCTAFKNESTCLLPEDRGKGIVSRNPDNGRYYLHGVAIYGYNECQNPFWDTTIAAYVQFIRSLEFHLKVYYNYRYDYELKKFYKRFKNTYGDLR